MFRKYCEGKVIDTFNLADIAILATKNKKKGRKKKKNGKKKEEGKGKEEWDSYRLLFSFFTDYSRHEKVCRCIDDYVVIYPHTYIRTYVYVYVCG